MPCRWHRLGVADVREAGGGGRQGAGIVGRRGGGEVPIADVNRAAELVEPWERAAGRVSGRSHGGGGGGDSSNDCDPAAAVHVLVAVTQITAARMPAAMLDAAGAGGVACSNDGRLAAVVTPADRRRGLTAATTAAPAPGTPLAVAAATSPPSTAVPPATHRFPSAAVPSTAGPEEAAKGVGATAVAAGRSLDIRQEEVAASAAARMARRGGGGGCGPPPRRRRRNGRERQRHASAGGRFSFLAAAGGHRRRLPAPPRFTLRVAGDGWGANAFRLAAAAGLHPTGSGGA